MSPRSRIASILFAGLALVPASPAAAQTPKPAEMTAEVPALNAMHEVIMPMWHDAWPKKDFKALAAMMPDIERHAAAVGKAALPGILRDRQSVWAAGVADLQATVAACRAAVDKADNDTLLKAMETLHTQYEALTRIIRPGMKEIEDFHASFYALYHYQMNPFALARATESIQALSAKMETLNKAVLPDRLKGRNEAFTAQRTRLSKAVDAAVVTLAGKDEVKIREAIEFMHVEYQKLDQVF